MALQCTVCGTLFQKLFGLYISGFFSIFSTKCNCSQTFKNKSTFAPLSDSLPLPINFPKVSICRLSSLSFTSAKIGKEPSSEKSKASKTLKLAYILICTKVKEKKSIDLSFWIMKGEAVAYGCLHYSDFIFLNIYSRHLVRYDRSCFGRSNFS